VALEHQQSLVHAEKAAKVATKAQAALEKNSTRRLEIERRQEAFVARKQHLGPQRTIRQLDVAQDMILTATKLTAAQLISFAMREYLPSMPMTATTFIRRVFTIHGRKETSPGEELIVFYENPRDPAVNDALQAAAGRLNSRALCRGDRALRFVVESEPTTKSPGRLI